MTPNPQHPGAPAGAPQRTSGLAIAALVLGILGVCLPCPFGLVAVGLGIGALVKIGKTPGLGGKVLAIVGMILPLVGLPIQAAIAIPNFIKFQSRAKQTECRTNLALVSSAQQRHFAEHQAFSTNIEDIGFSPSRGNRYAYFLFEVGTIEDRSTASAPGDAKAVGVGVDTFQNPGERPLAIGDLPELSGGEKPGVHGQCPECTYVAACAGNIDSDATLDVWSVSSEDRTGPKGETIPAGTPFNEVNDVNE